MTKTKECRGEKKFVLSSSLRIPDPSLLGEPPDILLTCLGIDSHYEALTGLESSCYIFSSVQFSSVQLLSRVRLCDPKNRSTLGLPVHHQLLEFTQTHVHWASDAIQTSHPLLSPSSPAPNPSQHQSFPMSQLFTWGGQSTGVSASASFLPKKS